MINRVDNRSMMQCLLKCNELLKQVSFNYCQAPLTPPRTALAWQHCRHLGLSAVSASTADAAKLIYVAQGASVLFFPEGTRSKDGKMDAFKKVLRCLLF